MRRVSFHFRFISTIAAVVLFVSFGRVAHAQYVPVYGGTTYDTSNSTGYFIYADPPSANYNQIVSNNGLSLATLDKLALGYGDGGIRAIRWGPSEATNNLPILGTDPTGLSNSYLYGTNHANLGVGRLEVYDNQGNFLRLSPARWDLSANSVQELPQRAAGIFDAPVAINASGMAVGGRSRWNAAGTIVTTLDALPADNTGTSTHAVAINSSGTAVGAGHDYSYNYYANDRPVRWDGTGTAITQLGILGVGTHGITQSGAVAINDAGTAVGFANKYNDQHQSLGQRAVRWDAGTTTAIELGTLGESATPSLTQTFAMGINSAGDIYGSATKYDAQGNDLGGRAVRWNAGGVLPTELANLGTDLNGITSTGIEGINNVGGAVGGAEKFDGGVDLGLHAVYWQPDGTIVDLNTLIDPSSGWLLADAHAISDTGWITGVGLFDPDGAGGQQAYGRLFTLLVPEPGSALALLITMCCFRRNHSRRRHRRPVC